MKKTLRRTSVVNDHSHSYNDSESATTSTDDGHSHKYTVSADGKVRILEAEGHTHEPAAQNKETVVLEKKQITVPFEMKNIEENDEFFSFEGYASTFGNIDFGDDIVERGAFKDTLKSRMPKLLWQHKVSEPIGVFIEAFEDEKGLFVKGKMPKADSLVMGRLIPQMKIGSIDSMSIGFSIIEQEFDKEIRKIKKVELFEVSLVTLPMNPQATVTGMKAVENEIEKLKNFKDINNYLKFCGLSKTQTEGVMAKMREVISQSKSDNQGKLDDDITEFIKSNISNLNSLTKTIKEKNNDRRFTETS